MTREQEFQVDLLCRCWGGRVSVRDGFADGHIVATLPGGRCFNISEDGVPKETQPNHSVDWSE